MLPVFKGIITPIQIPITTTRGSHHFLFYLTCLILSEKHLNFLQTISTFRNVTYEEIRQLPFTFIPVIWHSGKETSCQSRKLKEKWVQSLGQEGPLEEEMAAHSSILAWRIPWTQEPGGLQSMWSQRVGHN